MAEHDGKKLNPATARAVSCALAIGGDIEVAVFAADANAVCAAAAKLKGVKRVLEVARAENDKPLAAILAPQIAKLAAKLQPCAGALHHLRQGRIAAGRGAAGRPAGQRRDEGN